MTKETKTKDNYPRLLMLVTLLILVIAVYVDLDIMNIVGNPDKFHTDSPVDTILIFVACTLFTILALIIPHPNPAGEYVS